MAGHYTIDNLKNIDQVKEIFEDGPDEMNWLFLSTSGVHGSYETLDDIEADDDNTEHYITMLVVHPRMVWCKYGHLKIERKDIPWLRVMVTKTIEAVKDSQQGNLQLPH